MGDEYFEQYRCIDGVNYCLIHVCSARICTSVPSSCFSVVIFADVFALMWSSDFSHMLIIMLTKLNMKQYSMWRELDK